VVFRTKWSSIVVFRELPSNKVVLHHSGLPIVVFRGVAFVARPQHHYLRGKGVGVASTDSPVRVPRVRACHIPRLPTRAFCVIICTFVLVKKVSLSNVRACTCVLVKRVTFERHIQLWRNTYISRTYLNACHSAVAIKSSGRHWRLVQKYKYSRS
jgi:hypothetical protein